MSRTGFPTRELLFILCATVLFSLSLYSFGELKSVAKLHSSVNFKTANLKVKQHYGKRSLYVSRRESEVTVIQSQANQGLFRNTSDVESQNEQLNQSAEELTLIGKDEVSSEFYLQPQFRGPRHPSHVNIDNFGYIATPTACKGELPTYLAYIHTAPANLAKRMNLRDSWGNASYYPHTNFFKLIFVIGRNKNMDTEQQKLLDEEMEMFKDILYCDYMDSYTNLTYKVVCAMRYVLTKCRGVSYIIKADDDTLVNMPALHSVMKSVDPQSLTIKCILFSRGGDVIRDPKGSLRKWYVSPEEYPIRKPDIYPRYCSGTGVIMTFAMLQRLYDQVPLEPWLWVDDVYFTGSLTEHIEEQIEWQGVKSSWGYFPSLKVLNLTKPEKPPHEVVFLHSDSKETTLHECI